MGDGIRSITEILQDVLTNIQDIVRAEVRLAKAELGEDLGRYAFRPWTCRTTLDAGVHLLKVRAVSRSGEAQPETARWNPAGYLRNVVETTRC